MRPLRVPITPVVTIAALTIAGGCAPNARMDRPTDVSPVTSPATATPSPLPAPSAAEPSAAEPPSASAGGPVAFAVGTDVVVQLRRDALGLTSNTPIDPREPNARYRLSLRGRLADVSEAGLRLSDPDGRQIWVPMTSVLLVERAER